MAYQNTSILLSVYSAMKAKLLNPTPMATIQLGPSENLTTVFKCLSKAMWEVTSAYPSMCEGKKSF